MSSGILDLNELSRYLRIPKSTLYKLTEAGKIPTFKVGKQLRFRKEGIDKWVLSEERKTTRMKGRKRDGK